MIKLNEMIDYFRKEKQMTLEELGRHFGKSKPAMSRWIKGDRSPMIEDLHKLAILFQTDVQTLLYGFQPSEHSTVKTTHHQITVSKTTAKIIKLLKQLDESQRQDVLQFTQQLAQTEQQTATIHRFPISVTEAVAAGVGYAYGNNEKVTYFTNRDDLKPYDIATLVSGDSMEPMVSNGDIILIKQNIDFISGQVYAIDYNEKSYVKKVYFEKDNLRLVSLNEKYDDIIIPRQTDHYLNVVGLVVDWFTPIP